MFSILLALSLIVTVNDRTEERIPLYHFENSEAWDVKYPTKNEDLKDTTRPILILEKQGLTLTVHSFPYDALQERIPPQAQIERWKRQAGTTFEVVKVQNGGFWGLQIFAAGMLARAMQLDSELFQNLRGKRQLRSDYTLKVVGSTELIEESYDAIITLFDSFELIDEIPAGR